MREIKVRAYDIKLKQMIYEMDGEPLRYYNWKSFECNKNEVTWIITEWTGMKDKNGKEIYEGDIMMPPVPILTEKDEIINYAIIFRDASFNIQGYVKEEEVVSSYRNFDKWEVIGNIYENNLLGNDYGDVEGVSNG